MGGRFRDSFVSSCLGVCDVFLCDSLCVSVPLWFCASALNWQFVDEIRVMWEYDKDILRFNGIDRAKGLDL